MPKYPNKGIIEIIFDENEEIKTRSVYDAENNLESKEEYIREYDSNGNITKVILFEDGKIIRSHKREYEYF